MATDTDDLQAETAQEMSDNSVGNVDDCDNCSRLKSELHQLRVKNIALRDDNNKLRSSLNIAKKSKSDLVTKLKDAKAKQDEHFREYQELEAHHEKQRDKLHKTAGSLKKLQ